ncbi:luciferase family oxidoreductase [Streptomyces filamentosus NRRL 11379]|nr:luciferase family oxidoreductase [Streptomyces filamentosus NRRL 11379]
MGRDGGRRAAPPDHADDPGPGDGRRPRGRREAAGRPGLIHRTHPPRVRGRGRLPRGSRPRSRIRRTPAGCHTPAIRVQRAAGTVEFMRFSVLSLIGHDPHPLTGDLPSAADRFEEVIDTASVAERLGFDAYSVGERHAGAFLSSSPSVVLGAIAARTSTIRLLTGVTVVAILDPVRVAEDFATLDQISRGRVELVVGKGAEAGHFDLFGLEEERQWDLQKEKYELLRRLWTEEGVDWEGEFRPPLKNVTTVPRPYDGLPRIWHGSATSLNSPELAAKHGDPLFTANADRQSAADHRQDPRPARGLPPRPPVDHRGRLRTGPSRAVGDAPAVRGGDRPGGAASGAVLALGVIDRE